MSTQERGLFLMLPDCLLDDESLSEKCIIGFARLMRYCQQNRTQVFTGSLKKLARVTKMSKSTVNFFIPQWQERNLLTRDEDEDGIMTLTLHLDELWQENVAYCEPTHHPMAKLDSTTTVQDRPMAKLDSTMAKLDSTTTVRNVQPVSTNDPPNTIRDSNTIEDSKKGKEAHAPISESSQKTTFQKRESQNPQQAKLRLVQPHQGMEPSQKRLQQEIWKEVEAALGGIPFDEEDRKLPENVKGMALLIKKQIDPRDILLTINDMDDFDLGRFNLTLLARKIAPLAAVRKRKEEVRLKVAVNGNDPDPYQTVILPGGMIRWQGQVMTEDEAYDKGYNGGFERYV